MKDLSLKQRFTILITILIVVFIAIGSVTYVSLQKIKHLNELADNVQEMEVVMLELRKHEKDFLARSVIDPEFFEKGESKYTLAFEENIRNAVQLAEKLHESKVVSNSNVVDNLKQVEVDFKNYATNFQTIVQAKKN